MTRGLLPSAIAVIAPVALTTSLIGRLLLLNVRVFEAAATQPTFEALAQTISQFDVESATKPLVPAPMLAGSVPSVPNT
jgi:hypothetical protein